MRVTLKLFASLVTCLPREWHGLARQGNALAVDMAPGASIADLVSQFRLPADAVHLVLRNGRPVRRAALASEPLHDGDVIAVWPRVLAG